MQTELSENKILSMLKTVPGVQAILRQAEQKDALKASRADDVKAYLALQKAKREVDRRRAVESAKVGAKLKSCLEALEAARKEGEALGSDYTAQQHEFDIRRGELENRLRQSAPQEWLDRLTAIQTEIDDLTSRKFLSTTAHLDGRITNPEMADARERVNELIQERDQIREKILTEGGNNE